MVVRRHRRPRRRQCLVPRQWHTCTAAVAPASRHRSQRAMPQTRHAVDELRRRRAPYVPGYWIATHLRLCALSHPHRTRHGPARAPVQCRRPTLTWTSPLRYGSVVRFAACLHCADLSWVASSSAPCGHRCRPLPSTRSDRFPARHGLARGRRCHRCIARAAPPRRCRIRSIATARPVCCQAPTRVCQRRVTTTMMMTMAARTMAAPGTAAAATMCRRWPVVRARCCHAPGATTRSTTASWR